MPFDINNFTPTHTIAGVLAQKISSSDTRSQYHRADGSIIYPGKGRPLLPYTAPPPDAVPAFLGPEIAKVEHLHAEAVLCLLQAAVWPEWKCATGFAQSCRGDSATVLNERGPNGEKVVRICMVGPGRVSKTMDLLVPEHSSFEVFQR